jgi:hypothetical protein
MNCNSTKTQTNKQNKLDNKEEKQILILNDKFRSNYLIIDLNRSVIKRVDKKQFTENPNPVVKFRNFKIKLSTGSKLQFKSVYPVLVSMSSYSEEGLLSALSGTYKLTKLFGNITHKLVTGQTDVDTTALLLDTTSLMLQHGTATFNSWTPSYFVGFIARVYSILIRGKQQWQDFNSESLDGILMMSGAIGLPESFFSVLKKLNMITNRKIGDHPGLFLDCIEGISSYLSTIISKMTWLPNIVLQGLSRIFSFGAIQTLLFQMKSTIELWKKDKRVMLDCDFRKKVAELKKKIDEHPDAKEHIGRIILLKENYTNLERMVKSAQAYENCSRQEPVCVVLEGPPGVRKSIAMAHLVKLLNRSAYTHIVKATQDGKDHYDSYNNEEVFIMDDVGQQGVSQWRTIINMVSSIKMPLECAAVELKDTKYFDSKIIIVTTNNFSNLGNSLTKSDGISDIKALWRRAHVFSFTDVRSVTYKRFDIATDRWTNETVHGGSIKHSKLGTTLEIATWMTAHVELLENYYFNISENILLSASQIEIARDEIDAYKMLDAEALPGLSEQPLILNLAFDICKELIVNLLDYVYEFASSYYTMAGGAMLALALFGVYKGVVAMFNDDSSEISDNLSAVNDWNNSLLNKGKNCCIKNGVVYFEESSTGTLLDTVKRHVKIVKVARPGGEYETSHALVSGTNVVLPAHLVFGCIKNIIIYNSQQDFVNENRAFDNCPFEIILEDKLNDVAVIKLPILNLTPYKNISHLFKYKGVPAKNIHFVWSGEPVKIEGVIKSLENAPKYTTKYGTVQPEQVLTYEMTSKGFCGSILADENAGILGFHVAGNGVNTGIGKVFSQSVLSQIFRKLNDNVDSNLEVEELEETENFSGMIAKSLKVSDGPKMTHLKPTVLASVFEETKKPANLRALGVKTVKERAKRMHKPVTRIPDRELDFMGKFLDYILPNFSPISEYETIKGNEFLAPLNKDSVSGMDFPKNKEDYFDFTTGTMKQEFKTEIDDYRFECLKGYPTKITQHHTLKDELRLLHKVDKPRTFGVDSLTTQFEMKRLMGSLFGLIRKNKWENGIAIGLNPYKDWPKLYDSLSRCKGVWDGDIGEWDASVSPQIQDLLNKKILGKFVGSPTDREILTRVLELSVRSWVVAGNKQMFKTHGILSGMWITNLFNSIINRCYSAGWFCREMEKIGKEPSVAQFMHEVVDFVQGDDKIVGVKKNFDILHAMSMKDYYESCGMSFTDGSKGKINYKSKPIQQCVFLKREFEFNDTIGDIVGPLSLETLTNTLRWYKDDNEEKEILTDKLRVVERELFLHPPYEREGVMTELDWFMKENPSTLNYEFKSDEQLLKEYLNDPDYLYLDTLTVNGKMASL